MLEPEQLGSSVSLSELPAGAEAKLWQLYNDMLDPMIKARSPCQQPGRHK